MSIPRRTGAFLFVLIACSLCYAQQQAQGDGAQTAPQPQPAGNARLDELRAKGSEALYNLDYDEARRIFTQIQHDFPDSPAGPHSLTDSECKRRQVQKGATRVFRAWRMPSGGEEAAAGRARPLADHFVLDAFRISAWASLAVSLS